MKSKWTALAVAVMGLGVFSAFCWSQTGASYAIPWTPPPVQVAGTGATLMSSVLVPGSSQPFVQQIVLVDTSLKSMSVYHVQQETGIIVLKSVRRIDGDFGLDEFNGSEPSPSKVRGIQVQR